MRRCAITNQGYGNMVNIQKFLSIAGIAGLVLGLGFGSGNAAYADVHFSVRNCTPNAIHIRTYNGEDHDYTFFARSFTLEGKTDTGPREHTICHTGCALLESCEKHCQITARRNEVERTKSAVSVKEDHFIRILSAEHHYRDDIHEMGTEITYEITDYDKTCNDPAGEVGTLD